MPVEFLTEEHKSRYGQYCGEPNDIQITQYFHLDDSDKSFIAERRGDQNRLGFALQLTSVRFLDTFSSDLKTVPTSTQMFVARQLAIADITILENYAQRDTTKRKHNALIRKRYGFRKLSEPPWSFRLSRFIYIRAWVGNERPSLLFDFATSWLVKNKVLLPGATTLSRLISEIRERVEKKLWVKLTSLPDRHQKAKLETLLQVPSGQRGSNLDRYRKGPVKISAPAFNAAILRYQELHEFGISELDFSHIPPVRLKSLARYTSAASAYKIERMPQSKRTAMLLAFVKAYEVTALDDALDVLDLLISDIAGEAKKLGQKNRLRTLKDLDRSALTLASVCSLILDEGNDDEVLRDAIFSLCSKKRLQKSIKTINDLARPADDRFYDEMVQQYGRVRRFLPQLFKQVEFKGAPAGAPTLEALNYLIQQGNSRKQILIDPPLDIISAPWKRLVYDKDEQVTKRGYTLCFLDKLQDSLRRRDVYVTRSDRWGDPRAKLLQGDEWKAHKVQVCRSLGHPTSAKDAISSLSQQLDNAYRQVIANFDDNDAVNLDNTGKKPSLTITQLSSTNWKSLRVY